jgi:hypothetical protein
MANFLSKTRMDDLRAQLKFFENLTRNMDGRTTIAERIAINNYKLAICDLMCINNQVDGCYMKDLRSAPRTEYKFNK